MKIRDLARKSPKSRTSERNVSIRRSLFLLSFVRSLALVFTLACIASHVYASRELIGSSRFVDFNSFSLFLSFCSSILLGPAGQRKKRVKQRTNLFRSIPTHVVPMQRVHRPVRQPRTETSFCRLPEEVRYTPW